MADNNILRIKVGVAFNPTEIAKEANKAFKEAEAMQKKFNASVKDSPTGVDAQKALDGAVRKTNESLSKQDSIFSLITKNIKSTIANFLKFTIISSIFMAVTVTMRAMLGLMFELDQAYTNLKIVSGATAEEMENIDERVSKLSISLGRLKKEVVDATTEFLRAGYGIDASMTLAENAIKGANVGAVELADVTTYLIAGLRAFNFEAGESARILDVLFTVSNATAIDLQGIGEAFLRSANTLRSAGATLEEASALIAGANESIQDPSKVGTALKTIATRLRGVTDEGELVPTLEKDFKNLGIEIRNSEGEFRNIYDIFKDLSVAIKGVDDLTKQSILEKLAGKRQVNILQGLLNDFDVVEMSLEEGLNSFGQVSKAQEIQVQSLEGKFNILKESVGQLLTALSDPEGFKIFIDGITSIVKGITELVKVATGIPNIIKLIFGLGVSIAGLGLSIGATATGLTLVIGTFAPWLLAIGAGITALTAFSMAGQESKKSQEELNAELEKSTKIQGEFSKKFLQSSEEDQKKIAKSIKETIDALRELREEQAKNPKRSSKISEDFGQDVKFQEIESEINKLTQSLLDLGFSEQQATRWMDEYGNSALRVKTQQEILRKRIDEANVSIKNATDNTATLLDAKNQLTDGGAIELSTLEQLLLEYPEYGDALDLTSEAQIKLLDSILLKNKNSLKSEQEAINAEIEVVKIRLQNIQSQAKAFLGLAKIISWVNSGAGSKTNSFIQDSVDKETKSLELEIENLTSVSKLYSNGIKLQDAIISKSDEKAKKEEKNLTAQERALAEINYQIELQQKLIAQLSGDERESAQQKLILLYEKEKLALIAVRDSLNKTKLGADEYGNQVRDLSLKIEDANISILGLNKEILDTRSAMAQSKIDEYTKDVESLAKQMDKAFQAEIDSLKKAQEESDAYYEKRIDDIDAEIDGINKANEATEDKLQLEKALLDLQKLREERQEVLDNKNVRRVNNADIGYENISDPREIKRINEEIAKAESDVNDIRKEQAEKAVIDELETKKLAIENEQKLEQERYDKAIESLELYQTQFNEEIQAGGQITQTILGNALLALSTLEDQSYANRLSAVSDYVKEYNLQMSQISGLKNIISTNTAITTANKLPTSGIPTGAISTGLKVTGSAGATNAVTGSVTGNKGTTTNTGTTFNNTKIVVPNTSSLAKRFVEGGRTVE